VGYVGARSRMGLDEFAQIFGEYWAGGDYIFRRRWGGGGSARASG
jgi:hypothetical protein